MSIVFRGSRRQLSHQLHQMVRALVGTGGDPYGIVVPVLTRGAIALLSEIQGAFITKARGGQGSDGITWQPLKRSTIAQRRVAPGELRALGVGGRRERGLLTPAENRRWRGIFASTLANFRARGMGDGEAMALAAQRAWAILKASGAKTKLEVLGGRTVEILRDTGILLMSFTPGYEETPANPEGQILEIQPGSIAVGSKVPYAAQHHYGLPARGLPARPFWPDQLPESWGTAVADAIGRGMVKAITLMVEES